MTKFLNSSYNLKNTQLILRFQKQKYLTQWGSDLTWTILTSHMKVTKIAQKHILWTFWVFLVTFISDVKIVHVKS